MIFQTIQGKKVRRVVGMMSGTSVDGVDAALVEIMDAGHSMEEWHSMVPTKAVPAQEAGPCG